MLKERAFRVHRLPISQQIPWAKLGSACWIPFTHAGYPLDIMPPCGDRYTPSIWDPVPKILRVRGQPEAPRL